jgi:hypothetical protein
VIQKFEAFEMLERRFLSAHLFRPNQAILNTQKFEAFEMLGRTFLSAHLFRPNQAILNMQISQV